MNLFDLTIDKFSEGLRRKDFSATEVTKSIFENIEKKNKEVNAYLTLLKKEALENSNLVDVAVNKGENPPPLAGVPLAIKDNILIEGSITTAGSKILENYIASYDAGVIKKLKEAKAVFLGKTNLDEFAMGSSTENSAYGPTKNPHDLERVPGGSSGGSAAAVASNMAIAALGSDTGGSVRQPSAFCGVVGLKPTYGSVSRHGLIALTSSFDQIGPITKTVKDSAILFKAIAGHDQFDATSVPSNYGERFLDRELKEIKKLKIGLPKEYFSYSLDKNVAKKLKEAIETLKSLGFEFKEISLPHMKYAVACYYIVMPAEASTNLARFDGIRYGNSKKDQSLKQIYLKTRGFGFGKEPIRRIFLGAFVLSSGYYDAYYSQAQKVRSLIKEDFKKAFDEVDVIFAPTTPTTAFKFGEKTNDPISMYLSDIFTIPANLAGLPAISIPVKKHSKEDKELPVGFQLIGRHFHEADILGIGEHYERI